MSNWKHRLVQSITLGSQFCTSKTQERKLIQTNIAVYIAMVTILVFDIGFAISGNVGLIYSGLVQTPYWLLLPVTLLLNKRGRRLEAVLWLFTLVILDALTALVLAQGVSIGLHYYFVLFAIMPASFIDQRHWLFVIVLFVINFSLFAYFEIYGWQPHPAVLEVPEGTLHLLRIMMIASCVATVLLVVLCNEYYASENERQLQQLADTDALTGLPNRRAFMQRLERTILENRPFSLLLIDLDHFKRINDSHGHLVGDQALRFVASEMSKRIGGNDFIGRVGGEEFAVVMLSPAPGDSVIRAEELCRHIAMTRCNLGQLSLTITISVGLCQVHPPAKLVNVMTLADAALYEAKNNGRNRLEVTQSLREIQSDPGNYDEDSKPRGHS
ncbi:GGDEF domain-containing protein [Shewanella sp. JM162201]|uniref:diguanylate cyclase n=1 Tax=Shewanella jiangmenensis TaxID=2837387 RepID=A0ABS5V042_9GAMM|nr:GGDEF domain-containing protein [Shewanella jiangmenensis]MBT1443834.1 GGDEF domain-containing protein [Shewanella jiangmenensis]